MSKTKSRLKEPTQKLAKKQIYPSKTFRYAVSIFAPLYILFSLQASTHLAMNIHNGPRVWPWHAWNMFQVGSPYNLHIAAKGWTNGGKQVEVNLDEIFLYRRGKYKHGRYTEMLELVDQMGKSTLFKNRFSEYVVGHYNRKIDKEVDQLKVLDIYRLEWPKGFATNPKPDYIELTHRWHE